MRILYVAGEVAPFSEITETAKLLRRLPEAAQETGGHEVRITMPRYGVVSERRNRLHEVIRLSGTEVHVGEDMDTLKVKVASIPGIRLQVYFMDSVKYFKLKGLHRDRKSGTLFDNNPARALYFARASLLTARKLGWAPDIVHASGWVAGFIPVLLTTEFADDPLFAETRCVYTPDVVDAEITLSAEEAEAFGLDAALAGKTLQQIGMEAAHAVAYVEGTDEGLDLTGDDAEEQALELYRSLEQRELAA